MLNLICLLDLDAYPDAVDAWLDQHPLVLVSGNGQRVQQNFGRCLRLYLGDIMSF